MRHVIALALLVPAAVYADEAPGFVTLDRGDATSRVGVEASFELPNSSGLTDGGGETALRFEVHGQYVDPGLRVGGYAQVPISYVSSGDGGENQSGTGFGDAEIGALYVPRVNDNFSIVLRAGLALPTASENSNNELASLIGSFSRMTDFYLAIPHGTSLRLAVSPLWRSGMVFARADVGIDINLDDDNNGGPAADKVVRLNGAVGVDLGQFSVSLESVNICDVPANGEMISTGEQWINEGAVAGRLRTGNFQPYAAVVFPLDHDSHEFIDASFTLGLDARL
ncbi:MAG TPA: hypothetical protein VGG28_15305 [Kofleriaceae bacterium]